MIACAHLSSSLYSRPTSIDTLQISPPKRVFQLFISIQFANEKSDIESFSRRRHFSLTLLRHVTRQTKTPAFRQPIRVLQHHGAQSGECLSYTCEWEFVERCILFILCCLLCSLKFTPLRNAFARRSWKFRSVYALFASR